MKYVCNTYDCPRYYLCRRANVVMEQAMVVDFRDSCDEKHNYPYFQRNDATIRSLNEHLIAVEAQAKRTTDRIKAAIDILLEEEKKHESTMAFGDSSS